MVEMVEVSAVSSPELDLPSVTVALLHRDRHWMNFFALWGSRVWRPFWRMVPPTVTPQIWRKELSVDSHATESGAKNLKGGAHLRERAEVDEERDRGRV